MMDSSHATSCSGVGGHLSKLKDRALGHILSFLPAEEAARTALLSSRWCHVFGAVDTVSLEEPESLIPDYGDRGYYSPGWRPPSDPNVSPPFYSIVSAAIIARQRRRGTRSMIDDAAGSESNDDSVVLSSDSSDDDNETNWWPWVLRDYTTTRVIFSCAHLRSLSLSSCRLAPPDTISLPSLVTLLLSHISDPRSDVERLVAGCPRLTDLTLEACSTVTMLSIVSGAHLLRLALHYCHNLTAVAVDSLEL
ncbi:F-box/LRR-repeat protein At5g02910-like [Miscanthus floridulus]|uniref:F-box/LRR-repeat protein At5g02910-like n=1 Tax=Miscanthus floridulus TaxID=154761 RepID=UPI0034596A44